MAVWVVFAYLLQNKYVEYYSVYFAIATDAFAAVIQWQHVRKNPDHEKPFAWGIYGIGYGLAVFSVPEFTFENCFLPVYMCIMYLGITFPLVKYRIQNKMNWKEWI